MNKKILMAYKESSLMIKAMLMSLYRENLLYFQNIKKDLFIEKKIDHELFDSLQLSAYSSEFLMLLDVFISLTQFYSHKVKVAIIKDGLYQYEYLKAQLIIRQIQIIEFENEKEFLNQIDSIAIELHFVFWTSRDQLLGRSFLECEQRVQLHQILNQKRVFSFELCIGLNSEDLNLIQQFNYTILGVIPLFQKVAVSLLLHTTKMKAPLVLAGRENLNQIQQNVHSFQLKNYMSSELSHDQSNKVNTIETLTELNQKLNLEQYVKIYDRCFLKVNSLNAKVLKDKLIEEFNLSAHKTEFLKQIGLNDLKVQDILVFSELSLDEMELISQCWPFECDFTKILVFAIDLIDQEKLLLNYLHLVEKQLLPSFSWNILSDES